MQREMRLEKRNERKEFPVRVSLMCEMEMVVMETAREIRAKKRNEKKESIITISEIFQILRKSIREVEALPIKRKVIRLHKMYCLLNKYLPIIIAKSGQQLFIRSSYAKTIEFIKDVNSYTPDVIHSSHTIRIFMKQLIKYKGSIKRIYLHALDNTLIEKLEIILPTSLLEEIISYLFGK